jgi:hypothetical protein
MSIQEITELTPREHIIMMAEQDEARLAREHAVTIRQLELAMLREKNQAAVELKRLEAKWTSLLRLPSIVLRLPVLVIVAFGYVIDCIRSNDPSKDFWNLLK